MTGWGDWLSGLLSTGGHLGIYVDGESVFAARVVARLGGLSATHVVEPLAGRSVVEGVTAVIRKVQETSGRPASIVLGIPGRDVYMETRRSLPTDAGEVRGDLEPARALEALAGSPAARIVVRTRETPFDAFLHTVMACRESAIKGVVRALPPNLADRFEYAEPAPLAALRHSLHATPSRGPEESTIRVLAGSSSCAAFLLRGSAPLQFAVQTVGEPAKRERTVLSLVAGLLHHARAYLELDPRAVAVEGLDPATVQRIADGVDVAVLSISGPGFDGGVVATGLAMGPLGLAPNVAPLARGRRPRTTSATFPWWDVAVGAISLAAIVVALEVEARRSRHEIEVAHREWSQVLSASEVSIPNLLAERGELAGFLDAWTDFDHRPVSWSQAVSSLARALPDQARLLEMRGRNPSPDRASGAFTMHIVSPDRQQVLGVLLADPYLKRAFPRVSVVASADESRPGTIHTITASGEAPVADSPLPEAE